MDKIKYIFMLVAITLSSSLYAVSENANSNATDKDNSKPTNAANGKPDNQVKDLNNLISSIKPRPNNGNGNGSSTG